MVAGLPLPTIAKLEGNKHHSTLAKFFIRLINKLPDDQGCVELTLKLHRQDAIQLEQAYLPFVISQQVIYQSIHNDNFMGALTTAQFDKLIEEHGTNYLAQTVEQLRLYLVEGKPPMQATSMVNEKMTTTSFRKSLSSFRKSALSDDMACTPITLKLKLDTALELANLYPVII